MAIGPMFSGKTSWLLKRMAEERERGKRALLVKSQRDTRFAKHEVVAHSGERGECLAVGSVEEAKEACEDADVVGVDEGQFLPDLREGSAEMVEGLGKVVYLAGLDGDFARRRFGSVLDVVPLADSVTKLSAVCRRCGSPAPFTLRTVPEPETELIGGDEAYMPACRSCYLSLAPAPTRAPLDRVPRSSVTPLPG